MSNGEPKIAVHIAKSILDGSTPLPIGCKKLADELRRLDIDRDDRFIAIIGVDSEIDEFPISPQERSHWNVEALTKKDAELAAWLPEIREHVFDACQALIKEYEDAG